MWIFDHVSLRFKKLHAGKEASTGAPSPLLRAGFSVPRRYISPIWAVVYLFYIFFTYFTVLNAPWQSKL